MSKRKQDVALSSKNSHKPSKKRRHTTTPAPITRKLEDYSLFEEQVPNNTFVQSPVSSHIVQASLEASQTLHTLQALNTRQAPKSSSSIDYLASLQVQLQEEIKKHSEYLAVIDEYNQLLCQNDLTMHKLRMRIASHSAIQQYKQLPNEMWETIITNYIEYGSNTFYSLILTCRTFHKVFSNAQFSWKHISVALNRICQAEKETPFVFWCRLKPIQTITHVSLRSNLLSLYASRTIVMSEWSGVKVVRVCYSQDMPVSLTLASALSRKFPSVQWLVMITNVLTIGPKEYIQRVKNETGKNVIVCFKIANTLRIYHAAQYKEPEKRLVQNEISYIRSVTPDYCHLQCPLRLWQ
jgi:hypothetical protein